MKKLITENFWLKVASVFIAFLLWLLVVYTYNPAATANFTIGVNVINGESIKSLGKVYEIIEGDVISIRVKANASLIKNLKSSDFKATADVSKLSPTYHADIDIVCTKSDNVEITIISKAKLLAVKLEDLVEKQFPVTVKTIGEAENGYYVGDSASRPNLITISGGKKSIEKISEVRASVDVAGASSSFLKNAEPIAYDKDGNEVTTGSLNYSEETISVAVNIYKTKKIPIFVRTTGKPYKGYSVQDLNYEPKSAVIAAPQDILKNINSIILHLNIDGQITDVEAALNLADYLPQGAHLVDKDTTVNVKCNIVRLFTKEIEAFPPDVTLLNKSDKFNYEFVNKDKLKFIITGISEKVEKVSLSDISPSIDLSTISEAGEYDFKVKFKNVDGVKILSDSNVVINVTENKENTSPSASNINKNEIDANESKQYEQEPSNNKYSENESNVHE